MCKCIGDPWYGDGVYFANDASYSSRDWVSNPTANMKYIYLAKVLTGVYIKGVKGWRVLPMQKNNPAQPYDSAVDNETNPLEFAIFNDTQACPEYLLHFKTK